MLEGSLMLRSTSILNDGVFLYICSISCWWCFPAEKSIGGVFSCDRPRMNRMSRPTTNWIALEKNPGVIVKESEFSYQFPGGNLHDMMGVISPYVDVGSDFESPVESGVKWGDSLAPSPTFRSASSSRIANKTLWSRRRHLRPENIPLSEVSTGKAHY